MVSIPVNRLSEEELKEAIPEWSEGSPGLEHLLWRCYECKVATNGSDAGNHGHPAYVSYTIGESERENLVRILNATLRFANSDVYVTFYGNPWSGSDWHKGIIDTSPNKREDAEQFFEVLTSSLDAESRENQFASVLMEVYDFLEDKCSPLEFRVVHDEDNMYRIVFECSRMEDYWQYFTELFAKAGLEKLPIKDGAPFMAWGIRVSEENFVRAVKNILDVFMTEWNYKIPENVEEIENLHYAAKLMSMKFGTDERGVKLMNEWLNAHKRKGQRDVNY